MIFKKKKYLNPVYFGRTIIRDLRLGCVYTLLAMANGFGGFRCM